MAQTHGGGGGGILMPSGSGGLMRYNEEYSSKLKFSPGQIVGLIVAVVIGMAALKIFF